MGRINGCLKAIFVFFNTLFTVLGALMVYTLLNIHPAQYRMEGFYAQVLIVAWVVAVAVTGISLLGSFAACTESKCCLRFFAAFMGIGMVLMLICGIAAIRQGHRGPWNDYYYRSRDEVKHQFYSVLVIIFGFSFIALMGLVISCSMIDQISRYDHDPMPAILMRAYEQTAAADPERCAPWSSENRL